MNTHSSTRRLRGLSPAFAIAIACLTCQQVRAQGPAATDTDVVCEALMADYIF